MRFLLQTVAIGVAAYFVGRFLAAHDGSQLRQTQEADSVAEISKGSGDSIPGPSKLEEAREPVLGRIVEVLKSADSYQCAEKLAPLIEELSKEDLEHVVDPRFIGENLYGRSDDGALGNAFSDAVVRRWMKIDPAGAEEAIVKGPTFWLRDAYARIRPEKVIEQYAFDAEDSLFQGDVEGAFRRLAEKDVANARRYAERIVKPELRKKADEAIALGIAPSDPVTAAGLARELDSWYVFQMAVEGAAKIGPGLLKQVLETTRGKFRPIIIQMIIDHPGEEWDMYSDDKSELDYRGTFEGLRTVFRLGAEERMDLLDRLGDRSGPNAEAARTAIVAGWAAHDPKAAAEWAADRANFEEVGNSSNAALRRALEFWVKQDKSACTNWLASLPDGELHRSLNATVANLLARDGDLNWPIPLDLIPYHREDEVAIARIVDQVARKDPEGTAEWTIRFPEEADIEYMAERAMDCWVSSNAAEAVEWLENLPEGKRRDEFALAYIKAVSARNLWAGNEWIDEIEDVSIRRTAYRHLAENRGECNRRKTITWILGILGLDERFRNAMIRSLR